MKPTLLDTDILSLFLRGHPDVVANVGVYVETQRVLTSSIISYYEIVSGLKHRDAHRQLESFEALAERSTIVPLSRESVTRSAAVYAELRQRGAPLDDLDLLIAGTALANDLSLATRNARHFGRVPALITTDWSQPV